MFIVNVGMMTVVSTLITIFVRKILEIPCGRTVDLSRFVVPSVFHMDRWSESGAYDFVREICGTVYGEDVDVESIHMRLFVFT